MEMIIEKKGQEPLKSIHKITGLVGLESLVMRKLFILASGVFVSSLVFFSCSSSQQVTCPDHSDNAKIKHKTSQAYKPTKYKPPESSQKHRVKYIKPSKTLITTTEKLSSETVVAEQHALAIPRMAQVIESVDSPTITYQSVDESSYLDIKVKPIEMSEISSNYNSEVEKYKLTAANNITSTISTGHRTDKQTETIAEDVISVVSQSTVPTVSNRKSFRQGLRNKRRAIKGYIVAESGGEAKSVTGFAISALVLGVLSLFIPLVAPLALIFGIIALKRANSNPNKKGFGLAIAGLVSGIVGIAVFLISFIAFAFG